MEDNDLIKVDKANVKLEKHVTMLQVKYGYTREQGKKGVVKHQVVYEAGQKGHIKSM